MLLGIGTRVKFRSTPDSGVITDKLGDGMVMVHLDDIDMEIPAFEEDLIREENFLQNADYQQITKPFPNQKDSRNTPIQKKQEPPMPIPQQWQLRNSGISIAFVPVKNSSDEITQFDIWLLNDTPRELLFEFDFILLGITEWQKEGKIPAVYGEKIGVMPFDTLNDSPEIDIAISPISTEGVGEKQSKVLKIKAKQFIKNFSYHDFLQLEAHVFPIFESDFLEKKEGQNDLKKYTQSIVKDINKQKKAASDLLFFDAKADVNEYASFVNEVDLHIELLHENPSSLTNAEILMIQMRCFESFLAKAIRLGVVRVFVIHGVGKGKLRDTIHARLRRHSDVARFKNEYHERYGWGATEILLGKG